MRSNRCRPSSGSSKTTPRRSLQERPTYVPVLSDQPEYRKLRLILPTFMRASDQIVKDFLLTCFQKDPNLRVSAKKLMKHPWIVAARRQMTSSKEANPEPTAQPKEDASSTQASRRGRPPPTTASDPKSRAETALPSLGTHDEQIQRVQEWNEKLVKTTCEFHGLPSKSPVLADMLDSSP
jgi:serine/threonine protein kinase